jgi:hypothetical protein
VATYDIEQMVKEIQSAVSVGVMGMDKFSEEVRRGMQEVQHVGGELSQIIRQVQTLAPPGRIGQRGVTAIKGFLCTPGLANALIFNNEPPPELSKIMSGTCRGCMRLTALQPDDFLDGAMPSFVQRLSL